VKTLLLIKPDIVEDGLYGEIISLVLQNNLTITKLSMEHFSKGRAEKFYEVHKGRSFYPALLKYITSGPVVVAEIEAENAVVRLRALIGSTNPAEANSGTIRKMYGRDITKNAVHASDSPDNAQKELAIAFGDF
jgi:nucleoside-diphosphate kinase